MASQHHSFDVQLAAKYGIEEAILIHHFQHWISINKRMGKNTHEGKTWTYQTQQYIQAHFPYWNNRKKIERIVSSLVDQGVLIKGRFNKSAYDRTMWYAFKNEEMFIQGVVYDPCLDEDKSDQSNGQMCPIEKLKVSNQKPESVPPIPDTKEHILKNNKDIYVPNAVALEHAEFLFSQILKIKPNYKSPNLKSWSKSIEKMMTLDKRSNEEIRAILEWLPGSSFWSKNILSADKLREKFDQLELARQSEQKDDWYRKNLSSVIAWKKEAGDVLKHIVIKGDYVINPNNSKELNLKLTDPRQLKAIFVSVAGVRCRE